MVCVCVAYEIAVTTSDKKDAGMIHNAWLILEGEQKSSKEFVMENSVKSKVLRKYVFTSDPNPILFSTCRCNNNICYYAKTYYK